MGYTPTASSSNSPAPLDFCRATGPLPAKKEPTQTSEAPITEGPALTACLSSRGSDGPDRASNESCDLQGEYRLRSCGIACEATQTAAAATGRVSWVAPASALAVSRNRELAGQCAVGEQLGESRAWSSKVPRGERARESHSMSEEGTCLRRLVQKVGEARRRFLSAASRRDGTVGSFWPATMAKVDRSELEPRVRTVYHQVMQRAV